MKKLAVVILLGITAQAFAYHGYLNSVYGKVVKDGYNECVHTSYFDENTDGIAYCGEDTNTKQVSNTDAKASENIQP